MSIEYRDCQKDTSSKVEGLAPRVSGSANFWKLTAHISILEFGRGLIWANPKNLRLELHSSFTRQTGTDSWEVVSILLVVCGGRKTFGSLCGDSLTQATTRREPERRDGELKSSMFAATGR